MYEKVKILFFIHFSDKVEDILQGNIREADQSSPNDRFPKIVQKIMETRTSLVSRLNQLKRNQIEMCDSRHV